MSYFEWNNKKKLNIYIVTCRHHGEFPIEWPVGCKGDTTDSTGEFPEAISAGACSWSTLLYYTFCGIASRKIGIWFTEFINSLRLNTDKQKSIWITIWDRSSVLDNL